MLDAAPRPLTELAAIRLVERSGRAFSFDSLRGEVWVGNMFFSTCPHSCSRLTATVRALAEKLPEAKFVSVSVDPDNDTPARLADYAAGHSARHDQWFFLTGEMAAIQDFGRSCFGMHMERKQHLDRLVVVDRQGRWHGTFYAFDQNQLDKLEQLVRKLLAETGTTQSPAAGGRPSVEAVAQ
jgi:cytochrome oxidase Cu insertion factor (SCO1/SenC/PrrC family)